MNATTDMKATVITARLDSKIHRQLKELATREDRSVSWLVRRAIEEFVRRPKKRATR